VVVGSGALGGIAASTADGGDHWSVAKLFPIIELTSVSCVAGGHCWATGLRTSMDARRQRATIVHSTDGGRTWHAQRIPKGAVGLGSISCTGAGRCSAGGGTADGPSGHGFMLRTNNGARWSRQRLPSGIRVIHAVACSGPRACWAGGLTSSLAGIIVSTGDGGRHWSRKRVPHGAGGLAYITCAAAHCVGVARAGQGSQTVVLAR
jgi:photosystem II stability/assembly factor-like uncharacterized protein